MPGLELVVPGGRPRFALLPEHVPFVELFLLVPPRSCVSGAKEAGIGLSAWVHWRRAWPSLCVQCTTGSRFRRWVPACAGPRSTSSPERRRFGLDRVRRVTELASLGSPESTASRAMAPHRRPHGSSPCGTSFGPAPSVLPTPYCLVVHPSSRPAPAGLTQSASVSAVRPNLHDLFFSFDYTPIQPM